MPRLNSPRAKHRPFQLHMFNRFSRLSDPPAEKPVNQSALAIEDSQVQYVCIAVLIESPATIVTCIPRARAMSEAVAWKTTLQLFYR